jgi:anthranilate synthase component I
MEKQVFYPGVRKILADTVTPVSVYLRLRNLYPNRYCLKALIIME